MLLVFVVVKFLSYLRIFSCSYTTSVQDTLDASYRLQTNFIPLNYNLFLVYKLGQNHQIGHTEIELYCQSSSDSIILHTAPVNGTILAASIQCAQYNNVVIIGNQQNLVSQTVTFYLSRSIEVHALCLLRISFKWWVNLPEYEYYGVYSGYDTVKYPLITQFETVWARMMFPCFDEPFFKSTFQISVKLIHADHSAYTVLGNMPISNVLTSKTWSITNFEKTRLVSTYTLGIIVGKFNRNYTEVDKGNKGLRVTCWGQQEDEDHQIKTLVQSALDTSRIMQQTLKVPSSLSKLDIVMIDKHKWGSMEQWGIFPCTNRCYRDKYVVPHELIHQWFGNIVTMQWWDDIWLNEGLTQYWTCKIRNKMSHLFPTNATEICHLKSYAYSMFILSKDNFSLSDTKWHTSATNILWWHKNQVYEHGSAVMHMLQGVMGEDWFIHTLAHYLRTFAYKCVTSADFINIFAMVQAANEMQLEGWIPGRTVDFKKVMKSWIFNSRLPTLRVDLVRRDLILSQSCYHTTHACRTTWYLPVWYTHKEEKPTRKVLKWAIPTAQLQFPVTSTHQLYSIRFNEHCHGVYLLNQTYLNFFDVINGRYAINNCDVLQFGLLSSLNLLHDRANLRKFVASMCIISKSSDKLLWNAFSLALPVLFYSKFGQNGVGRSSSEPNAEGKLLMNIIKTTLDSMKPFEQWESDTVMKEALVMINKMVTANKMPEIGDRMIKPIYTYLKRRRCLKGSPIRLKKRKRKVISN